ncbi:MAG: phenylacetate--CoA ligase family protein [Bosea sp. (in: a-proteobacteria)]
MAAYFDTLETRPPEAREAELLGRLEQVIAAAMTAPAYAAHLKGVDPHDIKTRAALAGLPVLRKSDLPALHKASPPFGGFVPGKPGDFGRLFTSPGPIFEPEAAKPDPWGAGRACVAAGLSCGDVVLNTFSYHMTPGGFIFDSGARAAGCAVIPAGPGHTEAQLEMIAAFQPRAYAGTPDFLKLLIEAGQAAGNPVGFTKAVVSGAAFPPSLQAWVKEAGVDAYQSYATADIGIIAFETSARSGMVLNENIILEIVTPGTGDPVAEGDVGEILITSLDPAHPLIRLALGDLTAAMPGHSVCGRTNMRIKGWMGRADQTAKIKGMFVRPEQVAEIARRHKEVSKLRLAITRANELDVMTLKAELYDEPAGFVDALTASLQAVTKLKGAVEIVPLGALPKDGKVIADDRPAG